MIGLRSPGARSGSIALRESRGWGALALRASLACGLAVALSACGAAACALNLGRATRGVEQAREAGAEQAAPFEMTLAKAYLEKAREESAEAAYQDAVRFAKLSTRISQVAADRSRERSRGKP